MLQLDVALLTCNVPCGAAPPGNATPLGRHAAIFIDKISDGEGIQGLEVAAPKIGADHFG